MTGQPGGDGRGSGGEEGASADGRRPRSVYGVGREPDARFSLANERTALAWVRSGLGLVAGGVALTSVASLADLPVILDVVAAFTCLFGTVLALYALRAWKRNEVALRTGEPLPAPTALPLFVGGVAVLGLVLAGYAVMSAVG